MDDFICDILVRVCEPCYRWITVTCPSSIQTRNQIFDDGWHASRKAMLSPTKKPPEQNPMNSITKLVIDMLKQYKCVIENYNKKLTHSGTGFSPDLEKWAPLSETYLARFILWQMSDVDLRIGLTIENCLDLDRKIIDGVMGWGNYRKKILNKAKSEFISNYKFFEEYMKDNKMPRFILAALMDEYLGVSSRDELAHIEADLRYCRSLRCYYPPI